jgi:hypothetical protein
MIATVIETSTRSMLEITSYSLNRQLSRHDAKLNLYSRCRKTLFLNCKLAAFLRLIVQKMLHFIFSKLE